MEAVKWKMIEQAEEELQRLETEHPQNFHVLKMELKSLISLFQGSISLSQHHHLLLLHSTSHDSQVDRSSASTATTQASSCRKRKRGKQKQKQKQASSAMRVAVDEKSSNTLYNGENSWDERVEGVIRRAQLCLQKLHAFKTSL